MLIRPIPYRDPLAYFEAFANDAHAVLLDSAALQKGKGRFSYIASDPFHVIEARRTDVFIDGKPVDFDPFTALKQELGIYAAAPASAPAPFAGGAIGYFGYELGNWLERLPDPKRDVFNPPSLVVGFYDVVAAFDHLERKAWILGSGRPDEVIGSRADAFAHKLASAPAHPAALDWAPKGSWRPELERREIERRIARIVEYIHAGDIFQANFTQRSLSPRPKGLSDFMLYRRLRALNPAPFAAFLRCSDTLSVVGASPELFLRLHHDGVVEAHPIKGTRARDIDPARDEMLARELCGSTKDRAENLMIVDLMRNDLSRVCRPGSVRVPQLYELESFASVHHLTSVITGQLKEGAGAVDLLRATFPGGSVTGAPKIRAMEIIHELEPAPRGIYCGCLGWIGFDGAMDMSMTIRTLSIANDVILAQAGGGIVADSDPSAEYEESMIKIMPLLRAVTGDEQ